MPKKASGEFNQNQYINDFIKEKYDRINLTVPAGKKAIIAARAAEKGQSTNAYINALIDADLGKEAGNDRNHEECGNNNGAGSRSV